MSKKHFTIGNVVVSVFSDSKGYKTNLSIYRGNRLDDFMSTDELHVVQHLLEEAADYIRKRSNFERKLLHTRSHY